MPKAVRYDTYGDVDVLNVVEVERPAPGPGELLIEVRAAGVNPLESALRNGYLVDKYPLTFPTGQGGDVAGVIAAVGPEITTHRPGDEVFGYTPTPGSHAEYAIARADTVVPKPTELPWETVGALYTVGAAAYAAIRAVAVSRGDTVVVAGAAGGLGSIAVQLATDAGARAIGLASPDHHDWLRGRGVTPVTYGDGVRERIEAAAGGPVHAFIDAFGGGYVDLALALGVKPDRVNTSIDFAAAAKHGVHAVGNRQASGPEVLTELGSLVAQGRIEVPVARIFPLAEVRDAYRLLERRHTLGKIVLKP